MHILRKILLVLSIALLPGLLLLSALDVGIVRVIGSPAPIKSSLSSSGIYDSVVGGLLSQSKEISGSSGSIPFSDSAIRLAAEYAFPPRDIKNYTETVIDSFYRWLDGKTPMPDFKLDLTGAKTRFADRVSGIAKDRASKLPVCPPGNIMTSFDAFSATCLPRGMSPDMVASQIKKDVLEGQGFLSNPIVKADDLKDEHGRPIFSDKLSQVPSNYQSIKKSPFILILLSILLACGVVLLSSSRLVGLKKLGIILLSAGIFMLILARTVDQTAAHKVSNIKLDNPVLQDKLQGLATDILQKIDKNYWIAGIGYTVLGAATIGVSIYAGSRYRPKSKTTSDPSTPKALD